jgi:hypothetical protein
LDVAVEPAHLHVSSGQRTTSQSDLPSKWKPALEQGSAATRGTLASAPRLASRPASRDLGPPDDSAPPQPIVRTPSPMSSAIALVVMLLDRRDFQAPSESQSVAPSDSCRSEYDKRTGRHTARSDQRRSATREAGLALVAQGTLTLATVGALRARVDRILELLRFDSASIVQACAQGELGCAQ